MIKTGLETGEDVGKAEVGLAIGLGVATDVATVGLGVPATTVGVATTGDGLGA